MILITLFLGAAIALNSNGEPKVYPSAMYFPPSRPIYEKPTLHDWSLHIDEKKNINETKNIDEEKNINESKYIDETADIDETKHIDDAKHINPIYLHEQSKSFPSVNYFLPTRSLVDKPSATLSEWYPYDDEKQTYFFPSDHFEQMLDSIRVKRDLAGGALRIQTNNALPLHADVKPVGSSKPVRVSSTLTAVNVTKKVAAPEDTIYEGKSLRRSLQPPRNKLAIARSICRIINVVVLFTYVIVEFCPVLHILFKWLGP